jgi:hypothetical protein
MIPRRALGSHLSLAEVAKITGVRQRHIRPAVRRLRFARVALYKFNHRLRVREAAWLLVCSTSTVWELIHTGRLGCTGDPIPEAEGGGTRWFVRLDDVRRMAETLDREDAVSKGFVTKKPSPTTEG